MSLRPVKGNFRTMFNGILPMPGGYHSQLSVREMIDIAYLPGFNEYWDYRPLQNVPKWIEDQYEINARIPAGSEEAWMHQGAEREMFRSAMREMLKDRFKLAVHMQPGMFPGYKLVPMKGGPKNMVKDAPDPGLTPNDHFYDGGYTSITREEGRLTVELTYHGVTMEAFASSLSLGTGNPPYQDETGLKGRYDFKLRSYESEGIHDEQEMTTWDISAIGLTLKPAKVPGYLVVIDHMEKPDEN